MHYRIHILFLVITGQGYIYTRKYWVAYFQIAQCIFLYCAVPLLKARCCLIVLKVVPSQQRNFPTLPHLEARTAAFCISTSSISRSRVVTYSSARRSLSFALDHRLNQNLNKPDWCKEKILSCHQISSYSHELPCTWCKTLYLYWSLFLLLRLLMALGTSPVLFYPARLVAWIMFLRGSQNSKRGVTQKSV